MAASRGDTSAASPVERFKPTGGFVAGYVGLLGVVAGVGYIAAFVHTPTALSVALGLAIFGVVVWTTQLRSRAAVYPDVVRLKNALVDYEVPLRLVEEVNTTSTLNVWTAERRYVCIGIGESMRTMMKGERRTTQGLGMREAQGYAEAANRAALDQSATAYETFVATRIQELAEQAKRSPAPAGAPQQVRRAFAWPEIAAFAVIGIAFVVSVLI